MVWNAPLDLLALDLALAVLLVDFSCPLHELVVAVEARGRGRQQADQPRLVGLFLEVFCVDATHSPVISPPLRKVPNPFCA